MRSFDRALESGETGGFMKAVMEADSGKILGCAVLGVEGGEIMTIIQVAMLGKLPYTAMADAVFTHPLLAEGLNTLVATLDPQAWEPLWIRCRTAPGPLPLPLAPILPPRHGPTRRHP